MSGVWTGRTNTHTPSTTENGIRERGRHGVPDRQGIFRLMEEEKRHSSGAEALGGTSRAM